MKRSNHKWSTYFSTNWLFNSTPPSSSSTAPADLSNAPTPQTNQQAPEAQAQPPNTWQHALTHWLVHSNHPVLRSMGGCLSSAAGGAGGHLLTTTDGDEEAFHKRYLEDRLLGEGEFAQVKLCHDMKDSSEPRAVKILRKGMVFKDNTLYAPIKAETLRMECDILRTLRGKHYCLGLCGLYETARSIYVVTELCSGGEMTKYVSQLDDELRTEDVSRIAHQLLSALHHCATHGIIHRDVKPENCMFRYPTPGAELRLIDFGSGTMDSNNDNGSNGNDENGNVKDINNKTSSPLIHQHTTFAGSAFYISPEMFQRTYTYKTDVWSAGVTLYVLVAGYPAEQLQKSFNILHKSKDRHLRDLPNLPSDMPDSYYDMLEGLLTYRHKARKSAGDMLKHEFVQFHKQFEENTKKGVAFDAAAADVPKNKKNGSTTASISLGGSVKRHSIFLDYQKFERAVTTLLATMLSRDEFEALLEALQKRQDNHVATGEELEVSEHGQITDKLSNVQKLQIIPMKELKSVLKERKQEKCIEMIEKLPNASTYDSFAYHVALLKQFSRNRQMENSEENGGMKRSLSISGGLSGGNEKPLTNSVHGNDVYGRLMSKPKKGGRATSAGTAAAKLVVVNGDHSWHPS